MKKVFGIIIMFLILFIVVLYWSLNSSPEPFKTSTPVEFDNISDINFEEQDSILITATNQYKSNDLKKLMQGEHYRKAWSTPIKVPVVFLDSLKGGLKITSEGGGKQTQSLKLLDSSGIYYALRSINKNPDALVPEFAKTLGLENIVMDGISAQHPYSAIVVAELSEQVGVLHTFPQIVFVPKQPRLESYNDAYGNRIFLFEYETTSKTNWTGLKNVIEIIDTDDLQELKQTHKKNLTVDQNALVRARLFDLIIGDWDRHAKQWGWVIQKNGDTYNAIPLPVDRDNAFFNLGGIVPTMIANKRITPEMRPFKSEIDYLPGLVQDFDVYFLKNIPEDIFIDQAQQLQELLTDEVIDAALKVWPKDFYEMDAKEIASKLKSRRDHLLDYAKGFKVVLNDLPFLTQPLKGSENLKLSRELLNCFECN